MPSYTKSLAESHDCAIMTKCLPDPADPSGASAVSLLFVPSGASAVCRVRLACSMNARLCSDSMIVYLMLSGASPPLDDACRQRILLHLTGPAEHIMIANAITIPILAGTGAIVTG